jgi:hypothetical protein
MATSLGFLFLRWTVVTSSALMNFFFFGVFEVQELLAKLGFSSKCGSSLRSDFADVSESVPALAPSRK